MKNKHRANPQLQIINQSLNKEVAMILMRSNIPSLRFQAGYSIDREACVSW